MCACVALGCLIEVKAWDFECMDIDKLGFVLRYLNHIACDRMGLQRYVIKFSRLF